MSEPDRVPVESAEQAFWRDFARAIRAIDRAHAQLLAVVERKAKAPPK